MLNQGIKIILASLVLMFGCVTNSTESNFNNSNKEKSIEIIGEGRYNEIYISVTDSFRHWVLNKLNNVEAETIYRYYIDSLLCFNSERNRFIGCRHLYVDLPNATSNDIRYVYGEKINNKWYFFTGPSLVAPKVSNKENDTHQHFQYHQLHNFALKELYKPYILPNGIVNEEWFLNHFEGPGWGKFEDQAALDYILKGKRFTNRREFFEFLHYTVCANNWNTVNKDSIKPLSKSLP